MTVHVIMPVFNRMALTQTMLECLRRQEVQEPLSIIVVDDGSTDGTSQMLDGQTDVVTLHGNGDLWWGGGIDLGLRFVFDRADADDWVLLVNNDTQLREDFVQRLLESARANAPAAVGSVIRDERPPHALLALGTTVDPWRLVTKDALHVLESAGETLHDAVEVDVLSGRGVILPMKYLRAAGGMRPRLLPHYLADYELSLRLKKAGCRLFVNPSAAVYSPDQYGSEYKARTLRDRLFAKRSPAYLPAVVAFWWAASGWLQRLTLPFRAILFILFPGLRRAA